MARRARALRSSKISSAQAVKHSGKAGSVAITFQCPTYKPTMHHFDLVCAVVLSTKSGSHIRAVVWRRPCRPLCESIKQLMRIQSCAFVCPSIVQSCPILATCLSREIEDSLRASRTTGGSDECDSFHGNKMKCYFSFE